MDYPTKNNSKMLVIICPTTGATPIENINAILRVVQLSGGRIFEADDFVEDFYYGVIDRAESKLAAEIEAEKEEEAFYEALERALALTE